MNKKSALEIYCFHGLASSKNSFADIEQLLSKDHSVHVIDFCGFGDRISEKPSGDPIDFCSKEIFEELKYKENLVFIAHSMGSATALDLAEQLSEKIKMLIIIEGNLISEDCGYLSRKIAQEECNDVLCNLKTELAHKMSGSKYRGWREWAKDVKKVSPETLRSYSKSLVDKSDSGKLLSKFKNLNCKKLYLYGDEYIEHTIVKKLSDINAIYIKGAGHFVMTDKPQEVFKKINDLIGKE